MCHPVRWLIVLVLLMPCSLNSIDAQESPVENRGDDSVVTKEQTYVRGRGEKLELRLHGTLRSADGNVDPTASLSYVLASSDGNSSQDVANADGEFEVWLPVNQNRLWSVRLIAKSADGEQRGVKTLASSDLRQAAIDGVVIDMALPTRTFDIRVEQDGKLVSNAIVTATVMGGSTVDCDGRPDGSFTVSLLPDEKLESFTAHTDDGLWGGFQFSRGPVRDPDQSTHVIELTDCRDQVIRVVDSAGKPVVGVDFLIQIATPPPHFNYLGQIDDSTMTTGPMGEATFAYFPDWDEVHSYVEIHDDDWVIAGDTTMEKGVMVVPVKARKERKRWTGRVVHPDGVHGGFAVTLYSFEGEQENQSDVLKTFSDQDGRFEFDVLSDATYCLHASDARHTSSIIDFIPWDTTDGQTADVALDITLGVPVQVAVTSGPQRTPIPNQSVSIRQAHRFSAWVDGERRSYSGSRDLYVQTGQDGIATVYANPDAVLEVSIYNPDWRPEKHIKVQAGEVNRLELHRDVDSPRTLLGKVTAADDLNINPRDVEINVASLDWETRENQTVVRPTEHGIFSSRTSAKLIAVFARSVDGKASAVAITNKLSTPVLLTLQRTVAFSGNLVDDQDQPIAGATVSATARIKSPDQSKTDLAGFVTPSPIAEVLHLRAVTDEEGNYTIEGVPRNIDLALTVLPVNETKPRWLGIRKIGSAGQPEQRSDSISLD